jgi:capsular polysaccharide transport system permease protein
MRLARGAFIQLQVVHALVLRETRTKFGEHQLGYLWAVLEPLFWVLTFWGMYVVIGRPVSPGLDDLTFLTTGVLTYELFANNVTRIGEAINGNKPLLFYPQVQPIDLVWARAALESATIGAVFVLIVGTTAFWRGELPVIDSVLSVLEGLFLATFLGTSLGLLLCMLGELLPVVDRLRGPLMRPIFWISGLFFTLDEVPPEVHDLLLLNPVLHALELVRDGWFPEYSSPRASPFYVLCFGLAFMVVGLLLERIVRRRLELA